MLPYLIPKYVVQYNLMVNINHVHDEDDEVLKRFDHEPKYKIIEMIELVE